MDTKQLFDERINLLVELWVRTGSVGDLREFIETHVRPHSDLPLPDDQVLQNLARTMDTPVSSSKNELSGYRFYAWNLKARSRPVTQYLPTAQKAIFTNHWAVFEI